MLPEGTSFECSIDIFAGPVKIGMILELLSYGEMKGLGKWRNGSYGRFVYKCLDA
jgi:hypothetical protein